MKLKLLFCGLFAILLSETAFSQATLTDSIYVTSSALGTTKFYRNNRRLDIPEVRTYLETNPAAAKEFKKSRSQYTLSMIFGIVGGGLIGWELGRAIGEGKTGDGINWSVMAPGLVLTGFSIAFDIGSKKSAKRSVYLFNKAYR